MATARRLSTFTLAGLLALLALSVATCRVDMLVKPSAKAHPVLSVSPTTVNESARAGSDDVRDVDVAITNAGDGSFRWSASKDKGWISLDPVDGDSPGTMTISLDAHGLAPGTYEGTVTVRAPGTTDSVVAVAVTFAVQRAGLVVTPGSITHDANVNSNLSFNDTLRISNTGNGILVWTASKSRSWITLGAVAGTGSGNVPLTINTAGLAPGTYTDEVVITAPGAEGSPARVPVTLHIFEPGLAVTPSFIHDTANLGATEPDTAVLTVGNSGGGTITWTATKSYSWVTLSDPSGSAPPASSLTVTLDPTGLPVGTYKDTVVFRSPQATNDPVKIPVQLNVVRAVLTVDPTVMGDVVLPGDVTKRTHLLAITNGGDGALTWSAVPDSPWITLSEMANTVGDTITVTLDPAGMAPGTYSGKITVMSPGAANSPETVNVTLSVQAPCAKSNVVPDDVVSGEIKNNDCSAPHRPGSRADVYSVIAGAGDELSVRMTASFDAYLVITDGAGNALVQNDECVPETRTACVKNFQAASAGEYLIEATTADADANGSYQLSVVRELPPGAPQAIGQFKKNGTTAIPIGATTDEDKVVFRGMVSDPNSADTVRLEIELEPLGSPFTDARTHESAWVPARTGSVVVTVVADLTNSTGYHWQARTCDRTGRCSVWLKFGGNAETEADFTMFVGAPPPPAPPGSSSPQGIKQ